MIPRFLVCPHAPDLYHQLEASQGIVPVLHSVKEIGDAVQAARSGKAHLHCLWIRTDVPLSAIRFDPAWNNTPIALYASGMGRLKDSLHNFPQWRQMNLRIYLPATSLENLAALRILSSLGVETGIIFDEISLNWEMIADLMTYALFGKIEHASIGPFNYMADRYRATSHNHFGQFYFNDPKVYLHLDETGRVALTQQDYAEGRFIAESLADLGDIEESEQFLACTNRWREFFIKPEICSCCSGWKLCGGLFYDENGNNNGCATFFMEWMDALEEYQRNQPQRSVKWQP